MRACVRLSLYSVVALYLALAGCVAAHAADPADWTAAQKPFRIAGNLYYVGSRDLAAFLVATPQGNILINQNLESSPPQIRSSVEQLGFRWADTKILLNSQAHFDHVAGAATIAQQTGARVMTMEYDANIEEHGGRDDFSHEVKPYPAVHVARVLHDGDPVTLGGTTLIAHRTGGHTRGCTTWTFDVPSAAGRTLHVVIVGGVSLLSDYRLIEAPGHVASYPGIAQDFQHTFATLRALPCDIFLGAHGVYFDMQQKLTRLPREGERVWIDPAGYQQLISTAQQAFAQRLQQQQAAR
ncbi:subclass B3 metallo-beta-lactamase [Terriglobus sp.]|uniref:subclass B3 metallo-beta-lactamase n=1 Tax=Terriglobus sp. TaxID=1889013 RepID=UPI003AFFC4CD